MRALQCQCQDKSSSFTLYTILYIGSTAKKMRLFHTDGSKSHFDPHFIDLIRQRYNDEFHKLIEPHKSIVELKDDDHSTLLHHAATCGNFPIVKFLIDRQSDINARDKYGRTPLTLAATSESAMSVRVLLKAKANVDSSALRLILERRHMIDVLMQEVPLSCVLKKVGRGELRRKLEEAGYTWEHAVNLTENVQLLKVFLDREDPRGFIDDGGILHATVRLQKWDFAMVLLELGADVDAMDSLRTIAVRYLYCKRRRPCDRTLQLLKIFAGRAKLMTTSALDGRLQIYSVMKYGDADAVEVVMRSTVDLDVVDELGNTVMHYLALNGNSGVFERIRCRKFDANVRNKDGYIPLHYAASKKLVEAARFFLANGADVNDDGNQFGRTPLYFAFDSATYNRKLVELLLWYDADPQTRATNSARDYFWTIFDLTLDSASAYGFNEHLSRADPVIAWLAMKEVVGIEITMLTRQRLRKQSTWVKYLDVCRREVDKVVKTLVYNDVSAFEFLTGERKRILNYVRNEDFVGGVTRVLGEVDSPYLELIRERLMDARRLVELEDKVVEAIGRIFGWESNVHCFVARFVIEYFGYQDMLNLCDAVEVF